MSRNFGTSSFFFCETKSARVWRGVLEQSDCEVAAKSKNSNNDDLLDIHMLPHAHCDTGWLQTVQGYYDSSVRSILNTVVSSLYADKNLRFICFNNKKFNKFIF